MTQKTTVSLLDSALTPESPGTPAAVARVFIPGAVEAGYVHTWYEPTTGATPDTRSKMTWSIKQTAADSPFRVKFQLTTPKSQTVDGVLKRAHVNRAFLEFVFDKDSSRDDRRDVRGLLYALMGNAGFIAMIDDLEDQY